MSLFIASLNSGSNGNCYYIGNRHEAVLVDAGISCREIEKRMKQLNLKMDVVKAVFVSHEHTDHISGLPTLTKKYNLPVYITPGTLCDRGIKISQHLINSFRAGEEILIGNLAVTAFTKYHDAGDPHSFIVNGNSVTIGVFTDIGRVCEQLIHHFKQCHAAFLEANYDVEMLEAGNYPFYLKKRISGGMGHLNNDEALNLFITHRPAYMSHLLLSHLSKNNNCPKLVLEMFQQHALAVEVAVAPRNGATKVYEIREGSKMQTKKAIGLQMEMF